ncbi:MAG: MFS transporter [Promethearchaeota archaeon]|nr:MAG: MFS transporter [Candidatus Lokiarchaeota archaeon]
MTDIKLDQTKKSLLKRYLLLGTPRFGTNIVLTIVDFALLTLYSTGFKLPAWQTFLATSLGKISIALSEFLLGWLSDAKYTKWGRRKPYLIILSPLLGISFIFLLLPNRFLPISNTNALFIWLLVWDIIFQASFGVATVHNAWMAEQFEVKDRPKASQFINLFIYAGAGVGQIFTLVILTDFALKVKFNPSLVPNEFLLCVLIFGILTVQLFYIVAILMPTEPHYKIDSDLITNLKSIVKNKNYLSFNLMQGFASIAWAIVTPTMLAFLTAVLGFSGWVFYIGGGIIIIGVLIFLYLWRLFIEKLGKKKSLLILFLFAIVVLPFTLISLIPMESYILYGIIFIIGVVAAIGGWNLFPYIVYADLAEDNEKSTGELKAGLYRGFSSIILNIFQAIGLAFSSVISFLLGDYLFYIWWGPICSIILIGAYFYSKKFIKIDFTWEKNKKTVI